MYKTIFHIIIILTLGCIVVSCDQKPYIPDLKETYHFQDKKPFGGFVMHNQLKQMFPNNTVRHNEFSFADAWKYESDYNTLTVCITPFLTLDFEDIGAITNYVSSGNDLFIAASWIDNSLLSELSCKIGSGYSNLPAGKPLKNTHVNLARPVLSNNINYSYFYKPFNNYFYDIKNTNTKVLATNENGQPNCIVVFYGKGRLFLHCDPRAFSNYFLLKKDNYQYFKI
ncbi:MAG: hypothetical protein IPJ81_04900 [Chitinophagaceae bacterium]|nr:hypothetical protein [Chitinophagaceae bacterium]